MLKNVLHKIVTVGFDGKENVVWKSKSENSYKEAKQRFNKIVRLNKRFMKALKYDLAVKDIKLIRTTDEDKVIYQELNSEPSIRVESKSKNGDKEYIFLPITQFLKEKSKKKKKKNR